MRASGLANKLSASSLPSSAIRPRFLPSSVRALTTAREKVKVLLVLYDGGKHAQDVSTANCVFLFPLPTIIGGFGKFALQSGRLAALVVSTRGAIDRFIDQLGAACHPKLLSFSLVFGSALELWAIFARELPYLALL